MKRVGCIPEKRCTHTSALIKSRRSFLCGKFGVEDCSNYFGSFWKILSWREKQSYVRRLVPTRTIVRHRQLKPGSENRCSKEKNQDIFLKNKMAKNYRR